LNNSDFGVLFQNVIFMNAQGGFGWIMPQSASGGNLSRAGLKKRRFDLTFLERW
jgi:hypothetical protein